MSVPAIRSIVNQNGRDKRKRTAKPAKKVAQADAALLPAMGLPETQRGWSAFEKLPAEEKLRRMAEERAHLGISDEYLQDRARFKKALVQIILHDAAEAGDIRKAIRPEGMEDRNDDAIAEAVKDMQFELYENGLNQREKFRLSDLQIVQHFLG